MKRTTRNAAGRQKSTTTTRDTAERPKSLAGKSVVVKGSRKKSQQNQKPKTKQDSPKKPQKKQKSKTPKEPPPVDKYGIPPIIGNLLTTQEEVEHWRKLPEILKESAASALVAAEESKNIPKKDSESDTSPKEDSDSGTESENEKVEEVAPPFEYLIDKNQQGIWRNAELMAECEAGFIAPLECQNRPYVYAINCAPAKKCVNFICVHCGHAFSGFDSVPKHKKNCTEHPNKKTNEQQEPKVKKIYRSVVKRPNNAKQTNNNTNAIPNDRLPDNGIPTGELKLPPMPELSEQQTKSKPKRKRTQTQTEPDVATRKSKRSKKATNKGIL